MILAAMDMHLFIFALFMLPPPEISDSELDNDEVFQDNKDTAMTCFSLESPEVKSPEVNGSSQYQKLEQQTPKPDVKDDSQQLYEERNVNTHCENTHRELTYSSSIRRRERRGSRRLERRPSRAGSLSLSSVPEDDISRIFIPSYLTWLPSFRNSFYMGGSLDAFETAITESEESPLKEEDEEQQETPCTDVEKVSLVSESQIHPAEISIKEHFKDHLRVLADFKFMIYFISTIIWSMTTTMFVTFGPDLIVLKGHQAVDAAFVFTFYGVGQLIGCVFISITGNVLGRRIMLYMVANVLTGVFIGVVPLFKSFTELALVLVCMGFAVGGILGLYMIVSVDILGTKDMEIGLAYVLLASGMGCFAGPPLGGEPIHCHLFV